MKTVLRRINLVLVCLVGLGLTRCAPVFSEFQSARLVGEGNIEVAPAYTGVRYAEEGESESVQDQVGLRVGIGVAPKVDLQASYVFISTDVDESNVQVFAIGPKFSVKQDRVAINVPIGFAVSDDFETSETLQIHPTFIFTGDIGEQNEVSLAAKALIYLDGEASLGDADLATVLGFGFTNDRDRWIIRPEIGVLFHPGESGIFWTYGVGFGYKFQR